MADYFEANCFYLQNGIQIHHVNIIAESVLYVVCMVRVAHLRNMGKMNVAGKRMKKTVASPAETQMVNEECHMLHFEILFKNL
jgi:hypothetical protein